jgi:hypothetical protein
MIAITVGGRHRTFDNDAGWMERTDTGGAG